MPQEKECYFFDESGCCDCSCGQCAECVPDDCGPFSKAELNQFSDMAAKYLQLRSLDAQIKNNPNREGHHND